MSITCSSEPSTAPSSGCELKANKIRTNDANSVMNFIAFFFFFGFCNLCFGYLWMEFKEKICINIYRLLGGFIYGI